jgi:hypothetical protein
MVTMFNPGAAARAAAAQAAERQRELDRLGLASMEAQLLAAYAEKDLLQKELGVSAAPDLIRLVRALERRVEDAQKLVAGGAAEAAAEAARAAAEQLARDGVPLEETVGGADTAAAAAGDEVLGKLEEFSARVRILSGTVTSMEAQLLDLYAEKELLHTETGISRAADLVERFKAAEEERAALAAARARLEGLEAGERALREELNCRDAAEVAAVVRAAAERVRAAQGDLDRLLARTEQTPATGD